MLWCTWCLIYSAIYALFLLNDQKVTWTNSKQCRFLLKIHIAFWVIPQNACSELKKLINILVDTVKFSWTLTVAWLHYNQIRESRGWRHQNYCGVCSELVIVFEMVASGPRPLTIRCCVHRDVGAKCRWNASL